MRFRKEVGGKRVRWRWEGRKVEEVREYRYLGYIFQCNGGQENK